MTVRVNKSSFNIREKLSELGRKFGLKGSELVAAETIQEARDLVSAGRKNMVINGDMRISQRYGTTATTITSGGFVIDRYRCEDNTSASTTHQQVIDAPPGFHNSLKVTVTGTDTTVNSNDFHYFRHIIEGNNITHLNWGSSNAKTVTLSFWVKSSLPGTHGGSLWNRAFDRSFPFNYTINVANTWEHKSITIPGCLDGTWESGTDRGINIGFVQSVGSTYQGPPGQWNSAGDVGPTNHVNLTAFNGATWYITGIQLEVGRNATDFEYRSYGEELALCQRYFYKLDSGRVFTTANGTNSAISGVVLPVTMRDTPTPKFFGSNSTSGNIRMFSSGSGSQVNYDTAANSTATAGIPNGPGNFGFNFASFTPTFPAGYSGWMDLGTGVNNLKIEFDAEL